MRFKRWSKWSALGSLDVWQRGSRDQIAVLLGPMGLYIDRMYCINRLNLAGHSILRLHPVQKEALARYRSHAITTRFATIVKKTPKIIINPKLTALLLLQTLEQGSSQHHPSIPPTCSSKISGLHSGICPPFITLQPLKLHPNHACVLIPFQLFT